MGASIFSCEFRQDRRLVIPTFAGVTANLHIYCGYGHPVDNHHRANYTGAGLKFPGWIRPGGGQWLATWRLSEAHARL